MKCEEAYKKGYTIALRGMEFRFESIAAVADTLACLFGQPSVGANLYCAISIVYQKFVGIEYDFEREIEKMMNSHDCINNKHWKWRKRILKVS